MLNCYTDFDEVNGNFMPAAVRELVASNDLALLIERTSRCSALVQDGCCPAGYAPFNNQYCTPLACQPCFCDGRHLTVSTCRQHLYVGKW